MRRIALWALVCLFMSNPAVAKETPKWKIGGDFRVRWEHDQRPERQDRDRGRIRLRIKGQGPLSPDLEMGLEARTGPPENPTSANFSFYNSLNEPETFGFLLDQAFLRYHPEGDRGFEVTIGKSPHLLGVHSPYSKLLWDTDYAPLGVWVGWKEKNWHLRAGNFWLNVLPRFEGFQTQAVHGQVKLTPFEKHELRFDTGFYNFSPTGTMTMGQNLVENRGNATVDFDRDRRADAFMSEFQLLEPQVNYTFPVGDLSVTLGALYVHNLRGVRDRDDGFSAGFELGKLKEAGDWNLFYQYADLQQDAVFSPVVQTDFPLATNFQGHAGGVRTLLDEHLRLDAWVLTSARKVPEGPTNVRYRMDVYVLF
ncbi:MAG: putative porin [Candidatus Eremiobacterota bacterium]